MIPPGVEPDSELGNALMELEQARVSAWHGLKYGNPTHAESVYDDIYVQLAAIRQFEAVDAHCGYQLPWSPVHWLPGYDGAGYHDFHHARYRGNYAGFFGYMDRWLGTQARGFADWRRERRRAPEA